MVRQWLRTSVISAMLCNLSIFRPIVASMKFGFASKSCPPNFAVLLAGCGANDGSELHETISVMSHVTRNGATLKCFAPDIKQMHVIDHFDSKEEEGACRSVLVESARISRGNIGHICELISEQTKYDAIIVPGGFGAAKNLSDFAVKGIDMSVQKDVAKVLLAFHEARKPIGLCCIAPMLVAKLIPGVIITLGSKGEGWPFSDAIEAAEKLGAKTTQKNVNEVAHDPTHRIYSTPAFMYGPGRFNEIDDGVGNMVKEIVDSFN